VIEVDQKNITVGTVIISILALAAAGYSVTLLSARATNSPRVLSYDVRIDRFMQDNVSMSTDWTGNTFVVIGTIFPHGQIDKAAPVGKYTCFGSFTNSAGDDISVSILDITGVGQIILNGLEPGPFNVTYTGGIVGGTGQYVDAQGTYAQYSPNSSSTSYTLTITSTQAS
jgi:hypothetical protein